MLIRFIKPWQNFTPPAEVELSDPVAMILIQRKVAEVPAPAPEKTTQPRKPKKDKTNGPDA